VALDEDALGAGDGDLLIVGGVGDGGSVELRAAEDEERGAIHNTDHTTYFDRILPEPIQHPSDGEAPHRP
jgi:hypothetical protein